MSISRLLLFFIYLIAAYTASFGRLLNHSGYGFFPVLIGRVLTAPLITPITSHHIGKKTETVFS